MVHQELVHVAPTYVSLFSQREISVTHRRPGRAAGGDAAAGGDTAEPAELWTAISRLGDFARRSRRQSAGYHGEVVVQPWMGTVKRRTSSALAVSRELGVGEPAWQKTSAEPSALPIWTVHMEIWAADGW